jgi:hypothetical protein
VLNLKKLAIIKTQQNKLFAEKLGIYKEELARIVSVKHTVEELQTILDHAENHEPEAMLSEILRIYLVEDLGYEYLEK